MRRSGFDCGIGIDGAKSDPGGTGILPVKSGILPDFARTHTVRALQSTARNNRRGGSLGQVIRVNPAKSDHEN
jgi:hypothetical protein